MSYNKIVSVTGLGGLYELVSSKADGGIVRSLEDKSAKFVSNLPSTSTIWPAIKPFQYADTRRRCKVSKAHLPPVFSRITMQNPLCRASGA